MFTTSVSQRGDTWSVLWFPDKAEGPFDLPALRYPSAEAATAVEARLRSALGAGVDPWNDDEVLEALGLRKLDALGARRALKRGWPKDGPYRAEAEAGEFIVAIDKLEASDNAPSS